MLYLSQLSSSTLHSFIFPFIFFLQEINVKTAYEAGWQLSSKMWIHASTKRQYHTARATHIRCHRAASAAHHLPTYILLSAANSSTAVLFHVALDRRANATGDSNIPLLTFIKTPPHSCSPPMHRRSNGRLLFISTVKFSTYPIFAMCP